MQSNQGKSSLKIIIFQWWDIVPDYTRIYGGHFSFKLVKIIKMSKFLYLLPKSCSNRSHGGRDSTIALTQ